MSRFWGFDYDRVLSESDLAILVEFDRKQIWIPKSLIEDEEWSDCGARVQVWWLEEKGLI